MHPLFSIETLFPRKYNHFSLSMGFFSSSLFWDLHICRKTKWNEKWKKPILIQCCQPLALYARTLSRKIQPFPPLPSRPKGVWILLGAHKPKNVVPGKARMLGLLSHQILPAASCTCTHTLHQISTLSPSPFLQNNDFPCFEGFVCVGEKMWSPGKQGSRDPILIKFCQPLAIRTYNLSTKFQPFPPSLSCTTRISNMLRVCI